MVPPDETGASDAFVEEFESLANFCHEARTAQDAYIEKFVAVVGRTVPASGTDELEL